jgi:hypothetical protein
MDPLASQVGKGFQTVFISPRLQWPEKKKNLRFCDSS